MKKLLSIDCCIRGEASRTRRLAEAFLGALEGVEIERVYLEGVDLLPLDLARLNARAKLSEAGFSDPMFAFAKQFRAADLIAVAAPLWDMGVPAKLKTYFEHTSVAGLTFEVKENGDCVGCCKAKSAVFFTTRGMNIPDGDEMEQATPYVKAFLRFLGVPDFYAVSAWGLDMVSPEEVERRVSAAEAAARDLALSWNG